MDEARRGIILQEAEAWRAEGLLDEEGYAALKARYHAPPDGLASLPRTDSPPRTALARELPLPPAYATHLVGGLLLGAALIALVQVFLPGTGWRPVAAIGLGLASLGASVWAEARRGALVAEAGFAAGLVALGSVPFYPGSPALLGAPAAALALAVGLHRRGRTPLALFAAGAFFVNAQHVARIGWMGGPTGGAWLLLLTLAAYGALLARDRQETWGGWALALHALGLALALFPVLDAHGVTDPGIAALGVGALLGALFLVGVWLDARPLVATAAALLTVAAIAFAFLALGPALAAIILLLLGAVLVWHAEAVKGYLVPTSGIADGRSV